MSRLKGPLIRSLDLQELPEVVALFHAAHAWNLANGFNFTAATITLACFFDLHPIESFYVAELDGVLVGAIVVRPVHGSGEWGLHCLAVDPDAKTPGLGRKLVEFAERHAREQGGQTLILDTPENHPWLPAWYQRLGYRPIRREQWDGKNYRSVIMAKQL